MTSLQQRTDEQTATQLFDSVRRSTHRQIRQLQVIAQGGRIRITGLVPSFHRKQQVLSAVLRNLGPEIESVQVLIDVDGAATGHAGETTLMNLDNSVFEQRS